jgi:hypothetical protein
MKVRIDGCLDSSSGKGEFSYSLNLVTDASTPAAEDTFIGVSLEEERSIVRRRYHWLPRIEGLLHPVFIDQILEVTFAFFFTTGTDHRMVEQNELELQPSRFRNLWRLSRDLHPVSCGGETGRQKLRLSFLLNDTETAGAEGNEPSVVAERGDSDPRRLSGLEDCLSPLDHYLGAIDIQTNRRHFCDLSHPIGRME